MSISAVSGLSGIGSTPLNPNPAAPKPTTATPGSTTPTAPGEPTTGKKPAEPFLLVPTEPLTPKVLAELVGLQLFPNGPSAA